MEASSGSLSPNERPPGVYVCALAVAVSARLATMPPMAAQDRRCMHTPLLRRRAAIRTVAPFRPRTYRELQARTRLVRDETPQRLETNNLSLVPELDIGPIT